MNYGDYSYIEWSENGGRYMLPQAEVLMEKLSLDDVNKAIKKHFQVENMFVTIVTDASFFYYLDHFILNKLLPHYLSPTFLRNLF